MNRRCFLLACFMGWSSCCILEDRRDCPCTLSVLLQDIPAAGVSVSAGGQWQRALRDTTLLFYVPRGSIPLMAVSGASPDAEGRIRIPEGNDCPPLYLFSGEVECQGESARSVIRLQKQFCTLTLSFEGPEGWNSPLQAGIRGGVGGLSADGKQLDGPFHCSLGTDFSCRLPRQHPESELWLDLTLEDCLLRSFSLGTLLQRAGYDWTAPDLEDLPLMMDLSVTQISFHSDDWSPAVTLPIEI